MDVEFFRELPARCFEFTHALADRLDDAPPGRSGAAEVDEPSGRRIYVMRTEAGWQPVQWKPRVCRQGIPSRSRSAATSSAGGAETSNGSPSPRESLARASRSAMTVRRSISCSSSARAP